MVLLNILFKKWSCFQHW